MRKKLSQKNKSALNKFLPPPLPFFVKFKRYLNAKKISAKNKYVAVERNELETSNFVGFFLLSAHKFRFSASTPVVLKYTSKHYWTKITIKIF